MMLIFFILFPFAEAYIDGTRFYGDVKSLCVLTCDDPSISLSRRASEVNMVVSMVHIDALGEDVSKLDACLTQRLSVGVLLNANCKSFEKILDYASKNMMLDLNHKWRITHDDAYFQIMIDDNNDYNYTEDLEINNKTNKDDEECNDNRTVSLCNDFTEHINNITENFKINLNYEETNNTESDENMTEVAYEVAFGRKDSDTRSKVFAVLSTLNISVDADIQYAEITDSKSYDLYEIYNYGRVQGGSLLIKKIGTYSTGSGPPKDSYTYYRRWNFKELNLRIIIVMSPTPKLLDPEVILGRAPDARVAVVTQIGTQIIQTMAEIHNIKLVYTVVDRWVGNFQRNGTYTVTNALYFREADISPILRYIPPISDRLDLVSTSLTSIETKFYYRIPSSGPGNFENQFLTPLTPGAWWGVVGLCVICGVVLLSSAIFERRPFYLPYAFFSVFALVCQQFFEDDDKAVKRSSSARKITILVTGMSCVLIYNYYTSSVVSWLLNGPPPSINSLLELINSPLQPIFQDIGYTRSWLQLPDYYYNKRNAEDEDKLKKKMYKQMKKMSIFKNLDEGIEMVKQGGYAYHTEANAANDRISRTFNQRELCDMGSLQVMEKTVLFAATQKHSPYKEFFNWSFMRLNERGIVSCIRARMSSQESSCEGSSPRALALGGAAPAFILLAGGYVLATLVMMMERWHHRHQLNV